MLKFLVLFVNLLLLSMGEEIEFTPEELECLKELKMEKQQVLDHADPVTFVMSEDIPHIEEFADCVLTKVNVDIKHDNPDYMMLEKFLESMFHNFNYKMEEKLEFAKTAINKCKIVQKTDKNSITFLNCILKYSAQHL